MEQLQPCAPMPDLAEGPDTQAILDRPLELVPHVVLADLVGHTDGLLCLTASGEGALTRLLGGGQHAAALAVGEVEELFPREIAQ